jgi:hypothetical protein
MIPALLALLVQAQPPARQPAAAPQSTTLPATTQLQTGGREPRTPYDTTVVAIRRIALSVAEVKSNLGAFSRAAAREPAAVVVERATRLQDRCQALARSAAEDGRLLCRSCVRGERAAALERYRASLASLQQVGRQCSTTVAQLRRARGAEQAAAGLKREARTIGNRIATGLVPYEQRLEAVRQAFGWSTRPAAAPRPPG